MKQRSQLDVIIVGGGLSGSLTAWLLQQSCPAVSLRLVEQGLVLGGNHTWSFFESDLSQDAAVAVAPLVSASWPGYRVRFPGFVRQLATGYRSITSERLDVVIGAALGDNVIRGAQVTALAPGEVVLASGETLHGSCVIDARGARHSGDLMLGFQKFLGLEVRLAAPHGETLPTIMDATVAQTDGYQFVYTLPLAEDRLLIEDTYYSDTADLPLTVLEQRIRAYAAERGWSIAEIERAEQGVLPIILAGDIDKHLARDAGAPPRIGLGAAFFHPTTGYSLPDAARVAQLIAAHAAAVGTPTTESVRQLLTVHARAIWRERAYFRLLNRMMFKAGRPQDRYRILERFYRLDVALIRRFYAAQLGVADRLRIIAGRPPVPILSALACVSETRMLSTRGVT